MGRGLVLDAETTVAELAVEWYTNRSAGLSAARQGDYRIAINHHIWKNQSTFRLFP